MLVDGLHYKIYQVVIPCQTRKFPFPGKNLIANSSIFFTVRISEVSISHIPFSLNHFHHCVSVSSLITFSWWFILFTLSWKVFNKCHSYSSRYFYFILDVCTTILFRNLKTKRNCFYLSYYFFFLWQLLCPTLTAKRVLSLQLNSIFTPMLSDIIHPHFHFALKIIYLCII